MPAVLIKGRFWAEEGRVFFVHARTMPGWQALFLPFGGYLNLAANAATLLAARAVPIASAPYVTIATGLAFQMLPAMLLLTAPDRWLRPRLVLATALLLLLVVPGGEEVWLQTLHSQVELALACGLILALEVPVRRLGASCRLAVLFAAPLCGPGAVALLPAFALRALLDRSAARVAQAAALLAGSALQLGLFYSAAPGRAVVFLPALYGCTAFIKHVAAPWLGITPAHDMAVTLRGALERGTAPALPGLLALGYLGALAAAARVLRQPAALWMLAGAASLALLADAGAVPPKLALVDPRAGGRYGLAPGGLLALALLALASVPGPRPLGLLLRAGVAWMVAIGGAQYFRPWNYVADGPSWRGEIAAWRADPGHPIALWPTGWSVRLEPP